MKCNDCDNLWTEKLKKDKNGYYELDDVRCPKCGSKSLTVFANIMTIEEGCCFWCGKNVTYSGLKFCSEGGYCSDECMRNALLRKKKLLEKELKTKGGE